MLSEKIPVDPRLVVEALQVTGGDQLDQVAVAFLVFAEQHQVVVAIGLGPDSAPLLRDIDLAPEDWVDALLLGRMVELHRAE